MKQKKKKKTGREWIKYVDAFYEYFGKPVFGKQKCKCGYTCNTENEAKEHLRSREGHYLRLRMSDFEVIQGAMF